MTPFATRVDPFAILLVYLAEEHEQIRRSRISSALLLRAVTRSCHSASILAPLTSFAIRNRERQRLVALTIPIPSDSQCAEDVFLCNVDRTSVRVLEQKKKSLRFLLSCAAGVPGSTRQPSRPAAPARTSRP
jgi:hypothetical protein